MIPAHDNPLAAIAFNAQGTKIATASEKVSKKTGHEATKLYSCSTQLRLRFKLLINFETVRIKEIFYALII